MTLEKDGKSIVLDNENHVEAFLCAGWAEVKPSAKAAPIKDEAQAEAKPERKTTTRKSRRN